MTAASQLPREILRSAYHFWVYSRHLQNGVAVWRQRNKAEQLPPLRFRNGMIWHHGRHDEPLLIMRELYGANLYEPLPSDLSGHVVDIGANLGAVTMYWATGRPGLKLHAYEPNPQAFATLQQNIAANGLGSQVLLHNEAVAGAQGAIDLWIDVPTAHSTAFGEAPVAGGRKVTTPAISLDEVWQRLGRETIEMLKIDTEGAEVEILEGAAPATLAAVRNAVIEYHDNLVPGAYKRCRAVLDAAGFKCRIHKHPWDEGIIYATR